VRIEKLDLGSRKLTPLVLARQPDCRFQEDENPISLGDGRLAYIHGCFGTMSRIPERMYNLYAYDPTNRSNVLLRPYFIRGPWLPIYSISRSGAAVMNDRRGLFEQFELLESNRIALLHFPVERAGIPAWSPDGKTLAFSAAPKGESAAGVGRLDMDWRIFLYSPATPGRLRVLSGKYHEFHGLSWSPDGNWLAVSADLIGKGRGLWLIRPRDGKQVFLLHGDELGASSWLPDGRLAVTVGIDAPNAPKGSDVGLYVIRIPASVG
jgi:WD40 repeat protein